MVDPHRMVSFTINGLPTTLRVQRAWTLLDVIRDVLGLTGTKYGCGTGDCGACKILIDGKPRNSCSIPASAVEPCEIVTVEGLAAEDGTLHPVQQGIVEKQGFQCAFCMSGFIMSTVGYLKVNPNPTREELAHGISGNLCRCQDYSKILDALMHGAELSRKVTHA